MAYKSEESRQRQLEAARRNIQGYNWKNLTPEQRIEYRKKAQITREKKKEARKKMKEQLDILLSASTKDKGVRRILTEMGIDDAEMNNQMVLLFNMLKQGSSPDSKNAVQAATFIRDTVGEKPHDTNVNVETDFESYISNLESDEEF